MKKIKHYASNRFFSQFKIEYVIPVLLFACTLLPAGCASLNEDSRTENAPFFVHIAEKTKPAVVNISTAHKNGMRNKHLSKSESVSSLHSLGSGFIIREDGYIITNKHLIDNAEDIFVHFKDREDYRAEVIIKDDTIDIAVIKIAAERPLSALVLGNSSDVRVGEWVLAIGNPFGLEQTVTAGIVSATGRVIGQGPYNDFIQTDASIHPGNSGGPLINIRGEVVGVNTAIAGGIAGGSGIGFAVPIDKVKKIMLTMP